MGDGSDPVTRDQLRGDLAELRNDIGAMISSALQPVHSHISRLDRGEFNDAQKRSIEAFVTESFDTKVDSKWMKRTRLIAVGTLVITACGALATVAVAATAIFH